ncbi:MAG: adenylate/guanylate cyclase domain-containing protein [Nitrospirae bacterium]|nr:adenylate/guanylate cyclase domain-containing protein [Nitrospirota bacterium]
MITFSRIWLLALSALVSPVLFLLFSQPSLSWLDEKSRDLLMCLRGRNNPESSEILLYLDENTYRHYGVPLSAWYGPMAELVDRLISGGARAIVFDFLFLPTDSAAASTLPLAGALMRAAARGVPIIIASEIAPSGGIKYPYPLLRQAAAAAGFFNLSPSKDGVIRHQETYVKTDDGAHLSLAAAAHAALNRLSSQEFSAAFPKKIRLGFQPKGSIPSGSILTVIQNQPGMDVKARVVFVGPSPDFLSDLFTTPFNLLHNDPKDLFAGLEVHATTFGSLSGGRFIRDAPPLPVAAGLLFGAFVLLLAARESIGRLALALAMLCPLYFAAAYVALRHNIGLPVLPILIPWMVQTAVATGVRFWFLDRKKRTLEKAFGRYVNPLVLASILDHEDEIDESGKMVEACILVTDLKGFTTISEWMDPRDLVAMLNEYFEWTTDIIRREDGLVLSFPGDAILAVFGVPVQASDNGASAALKAALGLWEEAEKRKVSIHVAVSKGPLVIGRIGSRFKSDFTVIGDTVNTAFRIESYSDDKGLVATENVLLSATQATAQMYEYIETSEVHVKGKGKAVAIVKIKPITRGKI